MASLMDLFSPQSQVVPPPDPPSQLAQILQLGSVDQRHKLLQQQFDQAGQLAQGAHVDYAHGKGTPLALAGLANLFSAGLGGYQEGKAMGGLRDLIGQQDTGRAAAANQILSAKPPDLSSVLTAGPDALPGATQAAQTAIAGQRQSGLMALLSGDPAISKAGASVYGDADKGMETMLGMPQARNQLASGGVDLASKLRGQKVAESPVVASAGVRLAKKFGISLPDDTSAAETEAILPLAEKAQAAQKPIQLQPGASLVNPITGQQVAGGGNGGFDDASIDALAQKSIAQGSIEIPHGVRGPQAYALSQRILHRMIELDPTGNMAEHAASNKADSGSLRKLQVQADSIDSFEGTALKNLDNFLSVAKSISDTGIPLANKPIRAIADSLGGSPQQAQFNAARQVAIQEIGKVLGGAVAGGVVSDSQRHEVEGLMRGDATLEQLQAVAQTLRQDMANRKAAVQGQLSTIRGRIGGKPAEDTSAAPPIRKFTRGADGKLVEVK